MLVLQNKDKPREKYSQLPLHRGSLSINKHVAHFVSNYPLDAPKQYLISNHTNKHSCVSPVMQEITHNLTLH